MGGEWPKHWKRALLGDIADVNWGDTNVTKASYVSSGYVAYSATGPDGFLPYYDYDRVGVVLSAIGAQCGRTWLARGKWSCIKNTIRFWSKTPEVDTEFLFWITKDPSIWPKRGSAQPFIAQGDARALEVAYPPLPEQRAIARILGTLDDKIELNRRMNETLEAMAQALFKSWFVDFDPVVVNALKAGNPIPDKFADRAAHYRENPDRLGLPEEILRLFPDRFVDSELGPIPEGWEVKAIGELAKCVGGATPSTKNPVYWEGGTNPFLTPKDMAALDAPVVLDTARHITDAGVERISSKRLPAGTVLLSSRAPIGYLAINEVPVSINQGIIAMICDGEIPNYYALFWAKNNMDVIKGKAGGTTFSEISKKNFRTIPALRPSDAILDNFAEITGAFYKQIVENAGSSVTLTNLRDTLLPKLISGELCVPDVEKILEDAL